jgi:DNA-binding transcriptional ArsR family regulator
MLATHDDEKSKRVLKALGRRVRPYRDRDVAVASKLSLATVRLRLDLLREAGLVRERWVGDRFEPFWELVS